MRRALVMGSLFGLALVTGGGCSDEAPGSAPSEDSLDGSADGSTSPRPDGSSSGDAGADTDAAGDASDDATSEDATSDAGADAGSDAANDAVADTGSDASSDAASDAADAGLDATGDAANDASADADADASGPSQHVGGQVVGLLAGSVVLTNSGGDDRAIAKNGAFTFTTLVLQGSGYDVKVKTQPPGQSCTVTSGKGTVAATDVTDVTVTCVDALDCPAGSSAAKQTICGRLYDFADDTAVQADTSCTPCGAATASGPCSLKIVAYDSVAFAMNPAAASPLATAENLIDTCGRFRLKDLTLPTSSAALLLVDDAAGPGATGNTVPVAIAVPAAAGAATKNVEAFIADPALVSGWSGGPSLAAGIYAPIFRPHVGTSPDPDRTKDQSGVGVVCAGVGIPARDYYFGAAATTRASLDAAATVTGANGTALVTGATLADGTYTGAGGLSDATNCRWESRLAATVPSVLWVQIFRPIDQIGKTCPL